MRPKPRHMSADYAARFKDPGIVAVYHRRPPYPLEVFSILTSLVRDERRRVLDVGCGPGDIARHLVTDVDHVDAVDYSLGMIQQGQRSLGGDHPNLTWIHGAIEEAQLSPPYALITAGDSLHWFAWEIVFPRFAEILTPNGVLAIVSRDWLGPPALHERLLPIIERYSTNRDYRPSDLIEELELRGLFEKLGERRSLQESWRPTETEYLESLHSTNSLSLSLLGDQAAPFAEAVREVLRESCRVGLIECHDGRLELAVEARVVWGKPVIAAA
ncbi:MAG: class I SAM-dependent methyltransferase [Dehalococcoidia bacterium]